MVTNKLYTVNVGNKYTFIEIEFQKSTVNHLFLKHQNFSCMHFQNGRKMGSRY